MNDFQPIFDAQKKLFASGITRTYEWRIEQLDRMERLIRENEEALQHAIAMDFKTANAEYIFETLSGIREVEFQKSQLRSWMEPVEAAVPIFLRESGHKGLVYRDPYGVTLVMGPFNGPLTLLIRPALTALAAGNTCILKMHSGLKETSPLLASLIAEYFDPEAVAAVHRARSATDDLLALPFDFIFFTGSSKVGKIVARAAAENLTPTILELGGQNPALVDHTANVADAAKKITWGAMAWGGQWCTSPGYAYVHESIAEEFVTEAKSALLSMFGENPKQNADYSRIINPETVDRLCGLIDQNKVVAGGHAARDENYLDPTIMYPVSWTDKIMEDEIFGPILPILTYSSLDEAFQRIAATPAPLAGFVFSRDQHTIDRFIGELSFGGGAVNQTNIHLYVETMPFGGMGYSGLGQYYGRYGFDSLTHAKSILVSPADQDVDHLFPPFTEEKVQALENWFHY